MAIITKQTTLPDSSNKTDFYSLVESSTVTGIVNADILASAGIVDTKLATISTAGKVDGAAITGLSNVPSGAGVIPAVNLPNSIADSHLATISTAGKVSGAALTSLTLVPSGAGIIPIANLASGTPTGSKFIRDDGTLQTTSPALSNCLFQYSGNTDSQGVDSGEVVGTTLVPTGATGNYRFLQCVGGGGSYTQIWSTKFTKISSVSTVTIYARIWLRTGANQANIKVDIGGQNGNVSGTVSTFTPEWKTFTINVSSLSNGTVYDVVASMTCITATTNVYCSHIIAFGS